MEFLADRRQIRAARAVRDEDKVALIKERDLPIKVTAFCSRMNQCLRLLRRCRAEPVLCRHPCDIRIQMRGIPRRILKERIRVPLCTGARERRAADDRIARESEIIRRIVQDIDAPLERLLLLDLRFHENELRIADGKFLLHHRNHIVRRIRIAALRRQCGRTAREEDDREEERTERPQ